MGGAPAAAFAEGGGPRGRAGKPFPPRRARWADSPGFQRYHDALSRARWDARAVAARLLRQLIDAFLPAGEVVIGIDDTIERRWGRKIAARGIWRDPVRSSRGHFVKASGLRWLSLMVIAPIPWAQRRWAELVKVPTAQRLEYQRRGCRS